MKCTCMVYRGFFGLCYACRRSKEGEVKALGNDDDDDDDDDDGGQKEERWDCSPVFLLAVNWPSEEHDRPRDNREDEVIGEIWTLRLDVKEEEADRWCCCCCVAISMAELYSLGWMMGDMIMGFVVETVGGGVSTGRSWCSSSATSRAGVLNDGRGQCWNRLDKNLVLVLLNVEEEEEEEVVVDGLDVRRLSVKDDRMLERELDVLVMDSMECCPRRRQEGSCVVGLGDRRNDEPVESPRWCWYFWVEGPPIFVWMSSLSSHLSRTLVGSWTCCCCCCCRASTQTSSSSWLSACKKRSFFLSSSFETSKNVNCRDGCFLSSEGWQTGMTSVTIWYSSRWSMPCGAMSFWSRTKFSFRKSNFCRRTLPYYLIFIMP